MNNREVAERFLECFCRGDVDGLEGLLAPEFQFHGTLYRYHSAAEYLAALREDPPEPARYRLWSITENGDQVALFYDYLKRDTALTIAQLLTMDAGKIREIHLVFDASGL